MPRYIIAILFILSVNIGLSNVVNNWGNAYKATKHQESNQDDSSNNNRNAGLVLKQDESEDSLQEILRSTVSELAEVTLFFAYSFTEYSTHYPVSRAHYTPLQHSPPLFLRIGVILI